MSSVVFCYVTQMKKLNFSRNKIFKLVLRVFFGLSSLTRLDISYNTVSKLPPSVFDYIPSLEVFKCAGCSLTDFIDELTAY